jgi:hypothetical protein
MYQSAIFTVRKSSGQRRAVIDLRSVNKNIQPFLLQLPDMQQLLHSLAGQKGQFYSSLDLASGFWQIPLKNGISRDVTSFCDPVTGLRYRYTVAPFGLAASPAAMITVLMGIMSPLVAQNIAYCYMDDISIASFSWTDHLKKLETVLKTLDANNLSCQPTKASLAFPSIKFLGFEISKDGLKITDDKVKIINALKPPHDRKSLQKILGIWNFFRHFCPLFSKSTYHMRQLLKKDIKFEWTKECQAEFDNIIDKLTHAPILQPLSINKDFYLYCDSSYFGTGYACFQPSDDNPEIIRPVGYGGQALTPRHKSWSVLQIELLAVYHALKTYEPYCRHRTIHILSDNLSLVYLNGLSFGSPREKRMATYLLSFRLQFHHVSGKRENMLADGISRAFEDMSAAEVEEWIPQVDEKDDFLFAISHKDPTNDPIGSSRSVHLDDTTHRTNQTTKTGDAFSQHRWLSYSIQVEPAVTGHGPANGPTNPERCPRGQAVTHSKCAPVFDSCSAIGKQSTVLSADLPMKITQLPTVKLTQAPLFSDPDHSPAVQQLPVRPSEIAPVVRHSTLSPHAPSFYPRPATAVKVDQSADQRCTENHAIAAGIPNCQVIITADRAAADLTSPSLNDAMTDPDVWYDCPTDPESATVLSDTVLPRPPASSDEQHAAAEHLQNMQTTHATQLDTHARVCATSNARRRAAANRQAI